MIRIVTTLALALLPFAGSAGVLEEEFVRSIGGKAVQAAKRGARFDEVEEMYAALIEIVDWPVFAENVFGARWDELSDAQRALAARTFLERSAWQFARELEGQERLLVDGSDEIGPEASLVNTRIVVSQLQGRQELSLQWLVVSMQGRKKVTDIILEGRSSAATYSVLIDQHTKGGVLHLEKALASLTK